MTGRILLAGAALFLLAFLIWPAALAPLFQPFTRNNAPAIYAQTSLLSLTLSHLAVVAVAVAASTVAGLALAILVTRPAGREFLPLARTITSVGQTFPPVAVLALAVPIMGFGAGPTLVALFLYGLLPVFENTLAGLTTQPANVAEAARGMGLTHRQRLMSQALERLRLKWLAIGALLVVGAVRSKRQGRPVFGDVRPVARQYGQLAGKDPDVARAEMLRIVK